MRYLTIILLFSFTACATTPVTINQAAAVPASRILAPQLLAQASNTGSLVVKRDSGFMGRPARFAYLSMLSPSPISRLRRRSNYSLLSESTASWLLRTVFAAAVLRRRRL